MVRVPRFFYDHGDHIWGGPPGSPDEDGDRFIEIWNVVFMQNERFADGSMTDLAMQSIDTGMGLERIAALLQGSHDNYDTDMMKALIEASAHATSVDPFGDKNVHHRVIADHLRSTSFLIADGVMPSNEGPRICAAPHHAPCDASRAFAWGERSDHAQPCP